MGDLETPAHATSFSSFLPPGSRFFPSEQQLICYYLTSKNNGAANNDTDNYGGVDVIKEIDLHNLEPFNLPETAGFQFGSGGRRRHWYFYVGRVLKDGGWSSRKAGGGYWKKRKKVRDVMVGAGGGKVVVGTRKSFVFYFGDSPSSAVRTHWVMYEYTLIDHHHAGSFVLCRIFSKTLTQNSLSDHIISSCGDGSVASVRHVGVQCDENVISVAGEAQSHEKNTSAGENKVSNSQTERGNELGGIEYKPFYGQDLTAILDGDFIELDDLLCPLPGVD